MIEQLQLAARHVLKIMDVEILMLVHESGISVRGTLEQPGNRVMVKRELLTWEQVEAGRLISTIDMIADVIRRHG